MNVLKDAQIAKVSQSGIHTAAAVPISPRFLATEPMAIAREAESMSLCQREISQLAAC